jgi:hypothetical protein
VKPSISPWSWRYDGCQPLQRWLFASETPMGGGRNIVVACWANDRQTRAAGSGERAESPL